MEKNQRMTDDGPAVAARDLQGVFKTSKSAERTTPQREHRVIYGISAAYPVGG
jgi:hypothetical protein